LVGAAEIELHEPGEGVAHPECFLYQPVAWIYFRGQVTQSFQPKSVHGILT